MKIIYHCYGGAHSSVTAASIHLELLSTSRGPSLQDIQNMPYFDQQKNNDHGKLRLMGNDQYGNQIFIIGRRNSAIFLENIYQGMAEIFGMPDNEILMVNVMPYVNWRMVLGGFLSRRLGLINIGRPIVSIGTRDAFFKLLSLVQKVKMVTTSKAVKR